MNHFERILHQKIQKVRDFYILILRLFKNDFELVKFI